nr:sigma 54 modulation/S30EA ribosomal C-terminal domain-containing protein [Acidobacteriota bacterium]
PPPPARRASPPDPGPDAPKIRKVRYPIKPMTIDEAANLLQDTDEEFLVFRDARTESVAVLFRRNDGNLGLIETEQ